MITKIIEVTNDQKNWGKFIVGRPDIEWRRKVKIIECTNTPLLNVVGWTPRHLWVLDLQTGEGVYVLPGGNARSDLNKHRVLVCPLFEPFLSWLYEQDLADLNLLPDTLNLPFVPFSFYGYRRPGRHDTGDKTLKLVPTRENQEKSGIKDNEEVIDEISRK